MTTFFRNPIITKLRGALSGTILYRPARFLYNTIGLFNAQRTVAVGSLRVAFWTPTFKIIDDLEHVAEKEILLSFLRAIHTGDTVWDIGANIGLYTLFAAKTTGEQGHVIAVEPEPKTRSLLLRNVALNHIRNVTVLDCALGKAETTKPLYPSATPNPGSHSFVQRTDYKVRTKGIPVAIYPGDKLVFEKNVDVPHVVKIDVEGAELDVLLGMSSLLHQNTVRMMLIEVHPNVLPLFKASANDVECVVQSFGFSKVTRLERGTEYHVLCYRE